jgi:hypothetical protein
VIVLERAQRIDPIGAGLTLFANAMGAKGTIAIHRVALQRELAAAAGDVRLRAEITAIEQHGDEVVAKGADGSE